MILDQSWVRSTLGPPTPDRKDLSHDKRRIVTGERSGRRRTHPHADWLAPRCAGGGVVANLALDERIEELVIRRRGMTSRSGLALVVNKWLPAMTETLLCLGFTGDNRGRMKPRRFDRGPWRRCRPQPRSWPVHARLAESMHAAGKPQPYRTTPIRRRTKPPSRAKRNEPGGKRANGMIFALRAAAFEKARATARSGNLRASNRVHHLQNSSVNSGDQV